MGKLPQEFADLERFVDRWDQPSSQDRWALRQGMSMLEIEEFYNAMWPHLEAATQYVEQFPLDDMPDDAACLLRLVLAMMHASVAVEIIQAPRVPFAPWPHALKIERGFQPYG